MKRQLLTTAAALLGLGLLGGCASTNNSACEEPREGLFSRWFGHRNHNECPCECVETGRVTEGPILPEPPLVGETAIPVPTIPTMPPPAALPGPNPLAQPIPAGPVSRTKDGK